MLPDVVQLHDLGQTEWLAAEIVADLPSPAIILLYGDLGAGKTTLARTIIQNLTGTGEEVPSPTFTLVQNYESSTGVPIAHFDLYRLKEADEVLELGWEDALADGITLVEWPERLGHNVPRHARKIYLTLNTENGVREARLEGFQKKNSHKEYQ